MGLVQFLPPAAVFFLPLVLRGGRGVSPVALAIRRTWRSSPPFGTVLSHSRVCACAHAPAGRGSSQRARAAPLCRPPPPPPSLLLRWYILQDRIGRVFSALSRQRVCGTAAPPAWVSERWHRLPDSAGDFARELYDRLHRCDRLGAETILVQPLPDGDEWAALRDRLNRAAEV